LIDVKDYLRLVENGHIVVQIGEWLLRNACQQFRTWKSLGFFIKTLTVNVSLHQLGNPHFILKISKILEDLNLEPSSLILEISEAALLTKVGVSEKTLLMLKELGVQIGITDFGTGNIALRELQNLPIDHLKIASSLIEDITINQETEAIVKMMIALGNTLKLQVIATGVQTQKQCQLLRSMGCHIVQGTIFSPPVLPNEFTMLVEKSILESV
jgi:EAL domain-containing protein (putative c-di-GMP-specific phosphodiesterase class I)